MSMTQPAAAPITTDTEIVFTFPDEDHALRAVELVQELRRPRLGPAFTWDGEGAWVLSLSRPAADRFEYQLHLTHPDGSTETICDPANELRSPGPFGDKSVVELPHYRPPGWVAAEAPRRGDTTALEIPSRILRQRLHARIWTAAGFGPEDELPLLVAHDGPEYADYSQLTHYLDVMTAAGTLPPMRAALIAPVDRDQTYSASAVYARCLAYEVLPALARIAPSPHGRSTRVGMGASLGGLAMLHAHRTFPATFGGLFLQSGSFFRQRFDRQESTFVRFRRISRFVGRVLNATDWPHPIPATLTCGTIEENLANNRAVAAALQAQGYDVSFGEIADGHNWVAWRDAFDPLLTRLLTRLWG